MVNKKLDAWRKLVESGKINPVLWNIHFNKRPDKCTCKDCFDYKTGECKGGIDPIECLQNFLVINS